MIVTINIYVKRFAIEVIKIATTIKDVAKYTGLSIATISKYINGGNVLEENRHLLENAIKELGFIVNEIARGLKTSFPFMLRLKTELMIKESIRELIV